MKELKFRAWYKKDGEMRSPLEIWDIHLLAGRREDYILMQYTGLRDKNGKEIYEGDVIREDSPPHHCGEIKYDGGAFYISGITDGYSELCHILVDEFWAVIGDIYENPELLKGK